MGTCHHKKQEASYQDTIAEQDAEHLKQVDSLKAIIRQIPEHIYITEKEVIIVNDTTIDTIIKTEHHYIPVENPEVIYVIDTTGKIIDLIYSVRGLTFKPQIVLQVIPKDIEQYNLNVGLGFRWYYWNRFGLNFEVGIYPEFYPALALTYRLSQLKLGNCDVHLGTVWNGRFAFMVGMGIYLN